MGGVSIYFGSNCTSLEVFSNFKKNSVNTSITDYAGDGGGATPKRNPVDVYTLDGLWSSDVR